MSDSSGVGMFQCALWHARTRPVQPTRPFSQGTTDLPTCLPARAPGQSGRPFARSPACPPVHSPPVTCIRPEGVITERICVTRSRVLALAHPARPAPAMVPPFAFPPKFSCACVRPPTRLLCQCPLARPEMEDCVQENNKVVKVGKEGGLLRGGVGSSAASSFDRRGVWFARLVVPVVPEHRWPVAVATASGHHYSILLV